MTGAINSFERTGVISTGRGRVQIVDREALEHAAKGIYGTPEAEYERLIGVSIRAGRR